MNELFLQELNAITNYANSSNTIYTQYFVREMLENLLKMKCDDLYGNRCRPFADVENQVDDGENQVKKG